MELVSYYKKCIKDILEPRTYILTNEMMKLNVGRLTRNHGNGNLPKTHKTKEHLLDNETSEVVHQGEISLYDGK